MQTMQWQQGFKRIRVVGGVTLGVGLAILISVLLSQQTGYLPNPALTQLYLALWPVSLLLAAVGLLLLALPWVLAGFTPRAGRTGA